MFVLREKMRDKSITRRLLKSLIPSTLNYFTLLWPPNKMLNPFRHVSCNCLILHLFVFMFSFSSRLWIFLSERIYFYSFISLSPAFSYSKQCFVHYRSSLNVCWMDESIFNCIPTSFVFALFYQIYLDPLFKFFHLSPCWKCK